MAMARHVAFALIPVATFLSCCADQQSLDPQQKEDKAAQQEASKEVGSIDDARCQSEGFRPSSAGYPRCRKELAIEHIQ